MAKATKLLERMRANPAGDWTIDDVRRVCEGSGLLVEPPRRGSHFTIRTPDRSGFLAVPARRPIKPVYIREVVRLVTIMLEERDDA